MSIIDAALGKIPCDLGLLNVKYLDVFSCQWRSGDIFVYQGVIVGIESGLQAKRTINLRGKTIVPGLIDAHVHVESSMMTPAQFQRSVLPCGTTTAISDPHEIANVLGTKGIRLFQQASEKLALDLRMMMSSCVPATHLETNGGGEISAEDLLALSSHPKVIGLAEVMNVPGVLNQDSKLWKKLDGFRGRPIDGHAPLLRGRELSAYAAAGIHSCHESSELEEANEKLIKGISVWIREGSVAKDLSTLMPLINLATSTSLGFCTDDRNPLDIAHEGHLDHLVRKSIQGGIPAEVVYRIASWSVARHYGLDRTSADGNSVRRGAIAPGWQADIVVLDDVETCQIHSVWKTGNLVNEIEISESFPEVPNSIQAFVPEIADLEGPRGRVNVIGVIPGKIITEHRVDSHDAGGICRFTVLERYGKGSKPQNAYAAGFGLNFQGAIGSSVGHDSHNLSVVGSNPRDQQVAFNALIQSGGGFCVVKDGSVIAHLPLPVAGLMTRAEPEKVTSELQKLRHASLSIGCELAEPFLQLAFLSLPVIPSLKLTDRGLVDVNQFRIIPVQAS